MKKTVVLGFLGSTLDVSNAAPSRWNKWRPSVAICMQEDLLVDRLELIHSERHEPIAGRVAEDIASVSPETEIRRHVLEMRDPWDFEEVYSVMHDFVRSYAFDPEHEDYLVHITTGTHVMQICWFLLTEARFVPGRLLQSTPSHANAVDARGTMSVIDLDLSRYDRIAARFQAEARAGSSYLKSGIATRNAGFNAMVDEIEQVAIRTRAPLLLTGPTGAGKSQLARRIYELKKLKHQVEGAFVEVNCATLRGDNAMSALFGHVKGAFTGAASGRSGLLRSADKGVLFLDEIGDLGGDEQAMILRAIEDRRFLPVGADREIGSDFQLIAGTNRDLAGAVVQGRFRDDLFARLNLWTFRLPGLAERREDIEPNLDYELDRFAERNGARVTFNKEARRAFLDFATAPDTAWHGNFRDLAASVTRMATFAPAGRIGTATVAQEVERMRRTWRPTDGGGTALLDEVLGPDRAASLDRFDRAQLEEVIRVCRATRSLSEAGRALFSVSRRQRTSTNDADRLRKYLARFELDWNGLKRSDA